MSAARPTRGNQTLFVFPDMVKDESIILKIYDSLAAGFTAPLPGQAVPRAKWTLHSAYENPHARHEDGTAPGPRESCEVRLGLGRIVALYCRSSTSYRNR